MSSMSDFDGSGALADTTGLRRWSPTPDETYMALFARLQHQTDEAMSRIVYLEQKVERLLAAQEKRREEWPW